MWGDVYTQRSYLTFIVGTLVTSKLSGTQRGCIGCSCIHGFSERVIFHTKVPLFSTKTPYIVSFWSFFENLHPLESIGCRCKFDEALPLENSGCQLANISPVKVHKKLLRKCSSLFVQMSSKFWHLADNIGVFE